jgi:hypothetical protein
VREASLPQVGLHLGSWRSRLNCSGVMQVHWSSRDLLGEAGVERGFWRVLTLVCLFRGSSLKEYEEEALREILNDGDCDIVTIRSGYELSKPRTRMRVGRTMCQGRFEASSDINGTCHIRGAESDASTSASLRPRAHPLTDVFKGHFTLTLCVP